MLHRSFSDPGRAGWWAVIEVPLLALYVKRRHFDHIGRGGLAYADRMPRYEYRCRACGATFELSRPMSQASDPCQCPDGHDDTVKLLSTVAVGGRASQSPSGGAGGGGGGCCGGACGCR